MGAQHHPTNSTAWLKPPESPVATTGATGSTNRRAPARLARRSERPSTGRRAKREEVAPREVAGAPGESA